MIEILVEKETRRVRKSRAIRLIGFTRPNGTHMNGYLCPLASSSRSARSMLNIHANIYRYRSSQQRSRIEYPRSMHCDTSRSVSIRSIARSCETIFQFHSSASLSLSLSLPEICELNFAASTPVVWQDLRRTGRCLTEDYHRSIIPNRILRARPDPINGRKNDDSHARGSIFSTLFVACLWRLSRVLPRNRIISGPTSPFSPY